MKRENSASASPSTMNVRDRITQLGLKIPNEMKEKIITILEGCAAPGYNAAATEGIIKSLEESKSLAEQFTKLHNAGFELRDDIFYEIVQSPDNNRYIELVDAVLIINSEIDAANVVSARECVIKASDHKANNPLVPKVADVLVADVLVALHKKGIPLTKDIFTQVTKQNFLWSIAKLREDNIFLTENIVKALSGASEPEWLASLFIKIRKNNIALSDEIVEALAASYITRNLRYPTSLVMDSSTADAFITLHKAGIKLTKEVIDAFSKHKNPWSLADALIASTKLGLKITPKLIDDLANFKGDYNKLLEVFKELKQKGFKVKNNMFDALLKNNNLYDLAKFRPKALQEIVDYTNADCSPGLINDLVQFAYGNDYLPPPEKSRFNFFASSKPESLLVQHVRFRLGRGIVLNAEVEKILQGNPSIETLTSRLRAHLGELNMKNTPNTWSTVSYAILKNILYAENLEPPPKGEPQPRHH